MGSEGPKASSGQSENTLTKIMGFGSKIQNVITSATVEYSKQKKEPTFEDDFDHEDAWGDVKKAKETIGKYEQSITEGIKHKEEKNLNDYVSSPTAIRSSPRMNRESSPP